MLLAEYDNIVTAWQKKNIKTVPDLDAALGDFRIILHIIPIR